MVCKSRRMYNFSDYYFATFPKMTILFSCNYFSYNDYTSTNKHEH
jgi:hypothetical protein